MEAFRLPALRGPFFGITLQSSLVIILTHKDTVQLSVNDSEKQDKDKTASRFSTLGHPESSQRGHRLVLAVLHTLSPH